MEKKNDSIRDALLSRLPAPGGLEGYKSHVAAMLQKNESRIRRERIVVTAFWIFCAGLSVLYMWFDPRSAATPKGPFLACFMFLWGMAELLKHSVNACRIELLKEIKQVQIQMLDLQESLRPPGPQLD